MKRLIIALLALVLFVPTCLGESALDVDLSALSYDELTALRDSLNMEIWQAHTWREVVVRRGYYVIGVDIPAGEYRLSSRPGEKACICFLDLKGGDSPIYAKYAKQADLYPSSYEPIVWTFSDGECIEIEMDPVVFSGNDFQPGFKAFSDRSEDFDLEAYITLSASILAQIRSLPIWEDVPIYDGLWEVGKQIPVGHWSIFPADGALSGVHYGRNVTDDRRLTGSIFNEAIKSPHRSTYDPETDVPYVSVDAREGYYFGFYDNKDPVYFTPYVGNPLFVFND